MKRKTTLIVLSAVLLAICGGIAGVKAMEKHIDSIQTIDETVFALDKDTVTGIKWTNESGTVEFVKEDDTWKSTDDADFPVSMDSLDELFEDLSDVRASFIIDDVEDYDQYGLGDPEHTLTVTNGDTSTVITTGSYSTMDQKRYICIDSGTVYLIQEDIAEDLEKNRDDFLDNDSVPYFYQVRSVKTSGDADLNIIYDDEGEYVYTNNYNYYLKDGESYKALSTSKINTFLNLFTSVTFDDYASYKATSEDLSGYGFDSPTLTIDVEGDRYSESSSEKLTGSDEVITEGDTLYFVKKDDETVYLHVKDSPIVYNFDPETYEKLATACYDSLRPDEVVSLEDEKLESIAASVDSTVYTVDVTADDDSKLTYKVGEDEVDAEQLLSDIKGLKITEFNSDFATETKEFEFTLGYNGKDLKVEFFRVDGDLCSVVFNGEKIGYVNRSDMVILQEDFNTLVLNIGKETEEEESNN